MCPCSATLPDEVLEVLAATRGDPAAGPFGLLLRALGTSSLVFRRFLIYSHRCAEEYAARYGSAPLSGVVPDMAASTAHFIRLQDVYRVQAEADRAAFRCMHLLSPRLFLVLT